MSIAILPVIRRYMYSYIIHMYTCISLLKVNGIAGTLILCLHHPGAVYLKNSIFKYWKECDPNDSVGDELPYSIPEQVKALIRENVIRAIIQAPPLIG